MRAKPDAVAPIAGCVPRGHDLDRVLGEYAEADPHDLPDGASGPGPFEKRLMTRIRARDSAASVVSVRAREGSCLKVSQTRPRRPDAQAPAITCRHLT